MMQTQAQAIVLLADLEEQAAFLSKDEGCPFYVLYQPRTHDLVCRSEGQHALIYGLSIPFPRKKVVSTFINGTRYEGYYEE